MKKFMALLLVAGMTLSLTACGGSTDTAKTDQADGKDTFTVGFDQDFPPFGYVGDDGEFTGFDIEMATECAARMGKKIVLQPIDWDAKDMELEAGTIDCIWNGFTMNGREDQYTWTDPYMDNSQVVVVKKDSGINTLADLAGKVVEPFCFSCGICTSSGFLFLKLSIAILTIAFAFSPAVSALNLMNSESGI